MVIGILIGIPGMTGGGDTTPPSEPPNARRTSDGVLRRTSDGTIRETS